MVKVLICDDQLIVCEGLEKILSSDPEIMVVGIANNGIEALELIPETEPDIVLMDLKMPRMNGTIATRKIKEQYEDINVIVLTTYDDDEWVFDAIRSGASGYLLKDLPPADLIRAIKETEQGKSFIDPAITHKLLANITEQTPKADPPTNFQLSEREDQHPDPDHQRLRQRRHRRSAIPFRGHHPELRQRPAAQTGSLRPHPGCCGGDQIWVG